MSGSKKHGVHLSAVAGEGRKKGARTNRSTARFSNIQEKARLRIMDMLAKMYDQADDTLFEMADNAGSNQDQNIYFDAMREVRIKRRGMEMEFVQLYDACFRNLEYNLEQDVEEEVDVSKLSLVNDTEIEDMLALEGMVARAMNDCVDEVSLLSIRFDSLLSDVTVNNDNNPIGPQAICESFATVCSSLDVDIKARLLVLKLFENAVARNLRKLYRTLNRDLAEEGVLPNLSLATEARKAPDHSVVSPEDGYSDNVASLEEATASDRVFGQLQQLLQQAGSVVPGRVGPVHGVTGQAQAANGAGAKTVQRPMVLDMLSNVQNYLQQVPGEHEGYLTELPEQRDIRELILRTLNENASEGEYKLGAVDDDAISIVSLLFQFVLEDDNLAAPLKSLISLLQVPMAKVALMDKSFFGKNSHPARKLLNVMAQAGIGWSPSGSADRDFLYRKIKQVVETVLSTFEDDIEVFQAVLADFVDFIDNERRRASVVEQRTLETEQGRARADLASTAVNNAIFSSTDGKPLPGVVSELLQHAWSKVLFLVYAREGEDSGSWKSACRVMEELVWSVQPKSTDAERKRLAALKPGLFKSLESGLGRVGFSHFAMGHLFEQLEASYAYLLDATAGKAQRKSTAGAQKKTGAAPSHTLDDMLSRGKAHIETASVEPIVTVTEVADKGTAANNEDPLEDIDEAMLTAVDNLTAGSWVQFNQGDDAGFRCRLAAVMKPSGKYIFVNRSGKKVAEWTRAQLASNVAKDLVSLLDDRLLFDRALESVISQLHSARS